MNNELKENFVEWLREGILDKIISVDVAEKMYTVHYDDFNEDDFEKFVFGL